MKNFNDHDDHAARAALIPLLCALLLLLASCGGGSGDGAQPAPVAAASVPAASVPAPVARQEPAAPAAPAAPTNVVPVTVEPGPAQGVNLLFTSVTICVPGSSTDCRTIDHVLVDSGSSGLRIFSSQLNPALALPAHTGADGAPLAECTQFADSSAWGPLKLADVRLGGQTAASIPIQLLGDNTFPLPMACANTGPIADTVQAFGSNGVIGIGIFQRDCGPVCESIASVGFYYSCPASGCRSAAVTQDRQVPNPLAFFATDNNGVVITLPAVAPTGAPTVSGAMVFGIGTQANNGLGAATVFTVDGNTGFLTTVYKGVAFRKSFIDSGSNALYFTDSSIPLCSRSFYCPAATLSLSATAQGTNGASGAVGFVVVNAEALAAQNPRPAAMPSLAGPGLLGSDAFDWGLPFFYGRSVFTAFEGRQTPGGAGPFVAF